MIPDGRVADSGQVVAIDRPRRLVLRWRNEFLPEFCAEGHSICTFQSEPCGQTAKLTIPHQMDRPKSKFVEAASNGWLTILSSLKSLLETGEAMRNTRHWPTVNFSCPELGEHPERRAGYLAHVVG